MVSKATGDDNIPVKFIKAGCCFLIRPIVSIINKSLSQSVFPNEYQKAKVFPVLKSKGCTSLTNYRPISVLPDISKLLEKIVHQQVMKHLLDNDLLSPCQFGFRPGYTTQDVLIDATEAWRKDIDKKKFVGSVFFGS